MRPDPCRTSPASHRHGTGRPNAGHPGTGGHRGTTVGRPDADLAALRAIAALARHCNTRYSTSGAGPDAGHRDRLDVIRDLLIAHLAGGRARRAVTAHR